MLSSDDAHLVDGHFDLDRIIGLLGQALNQALHDGYQGVVATCALGGTEPWPLLLPDK